MVTIRGTSAKPCFLCGQPGAEVRFHDGTFSGALCKDHLWERLKPVPTKEVKHGKADDRPGDGGGPVAVRKHGL